MIRLDKSLHEAVDEIAHVNAERDDWQQRSDRMKDMNNDLTDKMSSLEQDFDKLKQETRFPHTRVPDDNIFEEERIGPHFQKMDFAST